MRQWVRYCRVGPQLLRKGLVAYELRSAIQMTSDKIASQLQEPR